MTTSSSDSAAASSYRRGAVVLAAYRPDPALFTAQLRSIRDQTLHDFVCLIGADGGPESVRTLVRDAVGEDARFTVVGWDQNVGFYLNFERLLYAVPKECAWIALSDHDDMWQADKLARLVPLLSDNVLVTGQARVVSSGAGAVLMQQTDRRVVKPSALLLHNQVSGALCVFRRELLDVALPFPRLNTATQLHDHWLGLCAAAVGGYGVLDEVVQDYVQHGGNLVGEIAVAGRRHGPVTLARRIRMLAAEYEGSTAPMDYLRTCQRLSFEWRELMARTLVSRLVAPPTWLTAYVQSTGDRTGRGAVLTILRGLRSPDVATSVNATFVAGLPGEFLRRWRRGSDRAGTVRPGEVS